jgi:hypothetical protein
MSFNSFEYATVFMEELDSQLLDQSTTGWMEENALTRCRPQTRM